MKKLFFILIFLALVACDNGVKNEDPYGFAGQITEIKLLEANPNTDGSWTYKLLLPRSWEKNLNKTWSGVGIKIKDGELVPLYGAQNWDAYYWEIIAPNKDVFFNFGHFNYDQENKPVWGNIENLKLSSYFIENNGQHIGITFRNGQISPVDPASLTRLTAIINASLSEVRENNSIRFSGTQSTGQASPSSKIVEYNWDFGDGTA
jgi:hypothetical protein